MRSHVLVQLSSTWIRLASLGGSERRSCVVAFDRSLGQNAWSDDLRSLDEQLKDAVERLQCSGGDAVALYESPTAVVDLHHAPVSGSEATQAALLALRDAAPDHGPADPVSLVTLGRDHAGAPRQTHVLGVIESAETAQAVIHFIERAGLRCRAVAPASASLIAASLMDALERHDDSTVVQLRIEDSASALTASAGGRVLMHRIIDIGVDRIVESMTRPVLREGGEIVLTDQEARAALERFGIPTFDEIIDEARGLTGADVLPIIQPVLQRLVVEVKQSLRFSLSEEQRRNLTLRITGAGQTIRRLAEILGTETDAPIDADAGADTESPQDEPAARAAFAERLGLLPPAAMKSRMSQRVRRGLVVGAAVAGALLAADAGWSVWVTQSMDQHIESLEDVAARINATRERLLTAEEDFTMARLAAAAAPVSMPQRAHWGAWMAELSRLTPAAVQLTTISGAHEDHGAQIDLHGIANEGATEASRQAITHFVEALRSCPLVENVELGGIRRSGDQTDAQEFDVTVRLATVPVTPPSGEESRP